MGTGTDTARNLDMYDRKTLTLAGELKRALRSEFPAAGRLSFADPDFMEILLDYAGRSRSSMVQAAAMTLRGHLSAPAASRSEADADADAAREEGSAAEPGETPDDPGTTDAAEPEKKKGRRVYRGRVINDD